MSALKFKKSPFEQCSFLALFSLVRDLDPKPLPRSLLNTKHQILNHDPSFPCPSGSVICVAECAIHHKPFHTPHPIPTLKTRGRGGSSHSLVSAGSLSNTPAGRLVSSLLSRYLGPVSRVSGNTGPTHTHHAQAPHAPLLPSP